MSPTIKVALLKLGREQEEHTTAEAIEAAHRMRDLFDGADKDGSGTLDLTELSMVVKRYYETEGKSRSSKVVQKEVQQAMQSYDRDGSGTLCFKEFTRMVMCHPEFKFGFGKHELAAMTRAVVQMEGKDMQDALQHKQTIRTMFDNADIDNSGTLDADELAFVIRQYYGSEGKSRSTKVVQREVSEAMASFDADGDGVISFEEFMVMMTSNSFNFPWPKSVKQQLKADSERVFDLHDQLAQTARNRLQELFEAADSDDSGTLNKCELMQVVKRYYSAGGRSRSVKAVQREVDEAMETYDTDKNGALCFNEVLRMVISSSSFNFGDVLPKEVKILLSVDMQRVQRSPSKE